MLGRWNTKWGSVLIPNAERGLPLQRLPRPGLVSCCLKGYRIGGSPQSGKDDSRPSAGYRIQRVPRPGFVTLCGKAEESGRLIARRKWTAYVIAPLAPSTSHA